MLHLLRIDLKKLLHYRTFWIVCGLYFVTLTVVTASGMEFLKWLARTVGGFGATAQIVPWLVRLAGPAFAGRRESSFRH